MLDGEFSGCGSLILNEIARVGTTVTWSLTGLINNDDSDHYGSGLLMHVTDAYNSKHRILGINDAGTPAYSAWQPTNGATVSALLSTAFYTPTVP